ncbi:hypothetical protein Voc01_093230 [Virgisporangium ochraceum]|uniref:Putative regulatory protein FmdB zinc ribbon domain-containing protein n=2 Tax=Virgisporangium ochraceum TaxID=65505 RepID=A0A8J4A7P3_9ACTN|nr:hypothetical protein Voc01_093230 [Virgisporangium ochraceum]
MGADSLESLVRLTGASSPERCRGADGRINEGRSLLATRRVLPIPAHTLYPMPRYDYRCRACGDTFELNRTMSEANSPAPCPAGHDDTVKLLSTIALTGRGGGAAGMPAPGAGGGGCCGGGCGCG